jgi:hypothetical protein
MFAPCGRLLGTTGFARGAPYQVTYPVAFVSKSVAFVNPTNSISLSPSIQNTDKLFFQGILKFL